MIFQLFFYYSASEDNLEYALAKENNREFIVGNDKTFHSKGVELLSGKDFVEKYLKEI